MSTTPPILADGVADSWAEVSKQRGIIREDLDLDGFGSVRQIADHVLEHLRKFDIQRGLRLFDLCPGIGDHLVDTTITLALQLDGDVACVGLRHGGEAHLQASTSRCAFDFRHVVKDAVYMLEYAVRLGERATSGHDVVEDEAAFVHLRQQVGTERLIAKPCSYDENCAEAQEQIEGESATSERPRSCQRRIADMNRPC